MNRDGSGILRHESRHDAFVPSAGPRDGVADAIERHIAEHFGPIEFVLHEVASHLVGVHVYAVAPTADRPFRTLITSGMSELPMTVPDGHDLRPYAELMICLPPEWPVRDAPDAWPVTVLKQVARLPHEYGTWIGEWHAVPNGDPAQPYAPGTPFAGVVVTPMITVGAAARVITVPDGTRIDLFALLPLHASEVALKVSSGTGALIRALDRGRVTEAFDPDRPPLG
jgi:hypothetical protein